MNHCHISLMCNDLPFLKQKLSFLYNNFAQLIFIDYDIQNNCNSIDGSIEYIENFKDIDKKIILLKNFDPDKIHEYNGVSMIEKRKMFAYGSKYIKDNIDIIWATDLDEFFHKDLINKIENIYRSNIDIVSIDIPHLIFVYNQYNIFNSDKFYICPRITRHIKNKIYGHCNFHTYGLTIKLSDKYFYHFSYVGYTRCLNKLNLYNRHENKQITNENLLWLKTYKIALENCDKYISIDHPNKSLNLVSIKYNQNIPNYINIQEMINELN